jgi:hypothetical protein
MYNITRHLEDFFEHLVDTAVDEYRVREHPCPEPGPPWMEMVIAKAKETFVEEDYYSDDQWVPETDLDR